MQYDLNLNANGSQRLEVNGRFFKYTNGAGKIRVTTNKGAVIDLTPGQGVWGEEFASLTVQDRSGAANPGVLLAGSYDFRDDTVAVSGSIDTREIQADMYQSNWSLSSAMTSGQVTEIVSAAANVRGIRIHHVLVNSGDATNVRQALAAKLGGSPANDGTASDSGPGVEIIATMAGQGIANGIYQANPKIVVPPGRALYWLAIGTPGSAVRNVKYTVL